MRILLLLRGSAGVGKSTYIREHGLQDYALSADDIRLLSQSPVLDVEGKPCIGTDHEKFVWETLFEILEFRMDRGEFTVIDATNSKTSEINRYKELASKYRYRMFCVDMTKVPIEECKRRNLIRPLLKQVPEASIEKMYARFSTQKIPSGVTVINYTGDYETDQKELEEKVFVKKFNFDEYKKIHHIGDVHGCYSALKEYFDSVGGIKEDEFYIFTGDYLDRGIENSDTLNFLISIMNNKNVLLLEGNHECFHKDTEVLTSEGWKCIRDITPLDFVAEFNLSSNIIDFARPLNFIQNYAENLISIETYDSHQIVTYDHDVVYDYQKVKASYLLEHSNELHSKFIPTTGVRQTQPPIYYDDNIIRLIVWIVCDGTIVNGSKYNPNSIKRRIQFHFKNQRKIDRLKKLLESMGIEYTFNKDTKPGISGSYAYKIMIYSDWARFFHDEIFHGVKQFPYWFAYLNRRQAQVVIDTLAITDGHVAETTRWKVNWSSVNLTNMNIIQTMCIVNGFRCSFKESENSGFKPGSLIYQATIKALPYDQENSIKVKSVVYKNMVYCLTMPRGTLITRFEGKVAFSGNCHLRKFSNGEVSKGKEFELITKPQLEKAVEDHMFDMKDVRNFCRKLGQVAYYEYDGKTILVDHAGVSNIPGQLTFIPTVQFIRGVGSYNDFEKVAQSFDKNTDENTYQLHGHRNTKSADTHVTERCFNLEGKVEFGGHLRVVQLDKEGFHVVEIKNNVFREEEEVTNNRLMNSPISDVILELRKNKWVEEKKFGDISSFNFTRDAFMKDHWDRQTVLARGLYINTTEGYIVARGYEKFFKINEMEETKIERLEQKLKFPVSLYKKENGYLSLIAYNPATDDFFITTKSNPEGSYAEWLKEAFYKQFEGKQELLNELKQYLKENNLTMAFENVDMDRDPHIIDYDKNHLFLLDLIKNEIVFEKVPYTKLLVFADHFGLECKTKATEIYNWQDFFDFYMKETEKTEETCERDIEGWVIEDSKGYMIKLKNQYYNFWKYMRGLSHEVIRKGYTDRTSSLVTPLANMYYGWLKTLVENTPKEERPEKIPTNIIALRNMFLEAHPEFK